MKKYFADVKGKIFLYTILMLIGSGIGILIPIINANLLTKITKLNIKGAITFATLSVIIIIIREINSKYENHIAMKIREKMLYSIRIDLLKQIFKMKSSNFDKTPSGEFQERIKTDPTAINNVFSIVQYSLFSMIKEIAMLIYVYILNVYIGIVFTIGLLIVYWYEKIAFKRYEQTSKFIMETADKNGTILNEILKGMKDIKLLNISKKFTEIAGVSLKERTKLETKESNIRVSIHMTTTIMETITTFAIIMMGIFLIKNKILTLTSFLIIFMYRSDIFGFILSYTSFKEYMANYKVARDRIYEIFDEEKYPIEKFGTKTIKNVKGKIEFKNVKFAYDKKKVLKDISFKAKQNEDIAIVGRSGSGKSTIFNLLTKSYDNYEGEIYIDDIEIKELSHDTLRNVISIIPQSPYIFNLTIKENLELIDRKVTKKEIEEACKIARIHDYIETLPDGYDTLLGEGGVNLSGGQKQRLAIARALLKKSKILLLDEATSALDNVTQYELKEAIDSISKDYTIITIAHRLSTIIESDNILLLDKGKIIEEGTHKKLYQNSKVYKELYKN